MPRSCVLGIIGPSGAGKTSLLNIISGKLRNGGENTVSGMYSAGEQVFDLSRGRFPGLKCGYVMQEDVLYPTQTVREAFHFAFRLQLGLAPAEIADRVEELLDILNLEACADTLIGNEKLRGISGGERKRCSIGLQLASDKDILVLDEPTSGLDSQMALKVMQVLHRLSRRGTTVILSIHQPSTKVYELIDQLCILSHGQCLYFGDSKIALTHFKEKGYTCPPYSNPCEFFLEIADEFHAEQNLAIAWQQRCGIKLPELKPNTEDCIVVEERLGCCTWARQLFLEQLLLFKREHYAHIRQPASSYVKYGQGIFTAAFIGLLFWNTGHHQEDLKSKSGACFFLTLESIMQSLICYILVFPDSRVIVERETFNGLYHMTSFYIAQMCIQLVDVLVIPAIMSVICKYMVNLDVTLYWLYIIVVCIRFTGNGYGSILSVLAPDSQTGIQSVVPCIIPLAATSGFLINVDSINDVINWAHYISPFKYGFYALSIAEFHDQHYSCSQAELKKYMGFCPISSGDQFLSTLDMHYSDFWENMYWLIGLGVGSRLISYLLLVYKSGF